MNRERVIIPFENKTVTLILSEFISDIDTDSITNIDYSNIIGELLTFSVIMNRIGILRAETQELFAEKKLHTRVTEARLSKGYRSSLKYNDGDKIKNPTDKTVESAVVNDVEYQNCLKNEIQAEKNYNIVDALYWAAKDKSGKLDAFSHKITPVEFEKEIVENSINGVIIKCRENVIKSNVGQLTSKQF